jgi:hypothetical protein
MSRSTKILWPVTGEGTLKLLALDESFIGTPDYMGIAYFWNYRYRHSLRGAKAGRRVRVHAALLKAGLPLDGESPAHDAIIMR